jgi:predicted pyridoxine 5'-phosphate oxidase superfamily flavin-nucleotide-binding protein
MKTFGEVAFTPAVQALQSAYGSRGVYARAEASLQETEGLGDAETQFLSNADSFYMATVGETGWPYVQHRGGPRGFLKVVSPTRIAFADFGGNRQYVSIGNASSNDRVALIVMDYARQLRLKLLGHARFENLGAADPELVFAVELPDYRARMERVGIIDVVAFDWNCPQHITQRYTRTDLEAALKPLRARITELEAQLSAAAGGTTQPGLEGASRTSKNSPP